MQRTPLATAALLAAVLAAPSVARAEDTYEMTVATVAPSKTPWAELLTKYKKNVEEKSGGRITVKVKLNGTLGDENATVRMVARGRLEAVAASTGALASLIPELDAIELPFLFRNAKEADYVLDNYLTTPMEKAFRKHDLVLGFWSENGFRHFASTWGAIEKPEDIKGRKMRSQENTVHLAMWKALKASAQAIPTTDVVTALKTGTVEGYDQALLYAVVANWYTSVKHLTLSAHIYQPAAIAFNQAWFDKLPADLQKILVDEGRAITKEGREAIRGINKDLIDIFKGEGVTIHTLSADNRTAFETATASVRSDFRSDRDKAAVEILDAIEKGLKEFRK
jgi:TRAP-type transport system periplasmic protein